MSRYADPIRLSEIRGKSVQVGERVAFTCLLTKGENVEFLWARNGQLLKNDGNHLRILFDEESSLIKISNVQVSDAGNYTCVAKNPRSEARVTAELYVEGNLL